MAPAYQAAMAEYGETANLCSYSLGHLSPLVGIGEI